MKVYYIVEILKIAGWEEIINFNDKYDAMTWILQQDHGRYKITEVFNQNRYKI
jgi:hypothetical protein